DCGDGAGTAEGCPRRAATKPGTTPVVLLRRAGSWPGRTARPPRRRGGSPAASTRRITRPTGSCVPRGPAKRSPRDGPCRGVPYPTWKLANARVAPLGMAPAGGLAGARGSFAATRPPSTGENGGGNSVHGLPRQGSPGARIPWATRFQARAVTHLYPRRRPLQGHDRPAAQAVRPAGIDSFHGRQRPDRRTGERQPGHRHGGGRPDGGGLVAGAAEGMADPVARPARRGHHHPVPRVTLALPAHRALTRRCNARERALADAVAAVPPRAPGPGRR